ncbi:MAG: hypothetical protein OK456_10035 [Thaumarchaeota archaeon]|nr:hypothetical protein [Nitrososphaerota archaeon]
MLGLDYMANVERVVDGVRSQAPVFTQAARIVVDSALNKGRFFVHDPAGMISYEASGRSAGLYMVKTLGVADLQRYDLSPSDVVLYFSRRSFVEGEWAFLDHIRNKGAKVIGVFPVSMPTEGRALGDSCEAIIDNGVPGNQGTVDVPGFSEKLGPIDIVVNCVILWSLTAEIIGEFLRRGLTPSVYMTIRAQDSEEYNSRIWAQYQRQGF